MIILNPIKKLLNSPVGTFALIAALFGLVIIVLMPPFTGSDEEAHFLRAYGITEGYIVLHDSQDIKVPKSFRLTLGCMQTKEPVAGIVYKYVYNPYGERKIDAIKCALSLKLGANDTEILPTTASSYSPTTFIPQVIAVSIGRLLDMPIILIAYIIRISVLIAYIAMIVFAIRLLPTRKWALVGVALLPISIAQVSNPGGDYMLFGSIAIFAAVIVRSICQTKSKILNSVHNDKLLLTIATISALLMVLPKGIFPGICFLPLIFFYRGFRHKLAQKVCIFVFVFLAALAWQNFGVTQLVSEQHDKVLSIINFPYAFIKTMFLEWSNQDFIYRGSSLGLDNGKIGMPSIAITGINMLLAAYLFIDYSERKTKLIISKTQSKLFYISAHIVASSVIIGCFAALYIMASYLQNETGIIKGVTSRYFYPAFFMLAIVPFRRFVHASSRHFKIIIVIGSITLLCFQVATIAIRYRWIIL